MKIEQSVLGIGLTVIGLILAILGMLSFTGLVGMNLPLGVMIVGYIVTIAGLAVIYADLRANRGLLEEEVVSKPKKNDDGVDPLFLTDFKGKRR